MSRASSPSLREGAVVKGYRVGRCIGSGSMGEVFEAKHEPSGRRVALKVLRGGTDASLNAARRLLEEARVVNAIRHPGIVEVLDLGLLEDRPWLAMELLEGKPLSVRLRGGLLPVPEGTAIVSGVLSALAAAHEAQVIHRDLKPSNVFLLAQPREGARVKLLDFGVARREGRTEMLTGPAMAVGSMGFMAPEQLLGHAELSSDLYAAGCLAFLVFAGRPVFPLKNIPENAKLHLSAPAPRLRTVRPEVPPAIEALVAQLLEKNPQQRPPSAKEALRALQAHDRMAVPTRLDHTAVKTELVTAFKPATDASRRITSVELDANPDTTMIDS